MNARCYMNIIELSDGFYYRKGYATSQILTKATLYDIDNNFDETINDYDFVLENIDNKAQLKTVLIEVFR